jgi:hypothetical protein
MSLRHTTGSNYSGLYLYSDPIFRPLHMLRDQTWFFCWRWNGLPILILPIAFLVAHDTYISARLAYLHTELGQIESALLVPDSESPDFRRLTRRLHEFSTALANLARRAHFQDTVLSTVTEALCTLNGPSGFNLEIQRARLDGLKKTMLARRYDLDMMPKRELTARATVGSERSLSHPIPSHPIHTSTLTPFILCIAHQPPSDVLTLQHRSST